MSARLHGLRARGRNLFDRARGRAASWPDLGPLVGLGLLLAVLFWPVWPLVPEPGLDPSWRFGLSLAHQIGLRWGVEVVFTYGPLYFLDYPFASSRPAVLLASVLWIAYSLVLTIGVHSAIKAAHVDVPPRIRLAVTAGVSGLLLLMSAHSGLLNLHVLVPVGLVLTAIACLFHVRWMPWIVGVVLGLLLLHKLSDAALVGAIAVFAIPAARGVSGTLRLIAGAALAFVVGWLAAGQALTDIPAYVSSGIEIVRGFAAAMTTADPGYVWQYPIAFALALLCLWTANRLARSHGLAPVARRGFVLGTGLALWVAAHEAFTRHDGHYWYFFAVVLIFSVIFAAIIRSDRAALRASVFTAVVAYLVVVTIYMTFLNPFDRQAGIAAAARTLGVISSQTRAAQNLDAARRKIADFYGVTPELQAAVGTAPTTVDPWDISALFATNATWDPLPVMQQYAVFTPTLDANNAASLTDQPRQILRSVPYTAIDGRNPAWEAPRYQRLVYCSYEVKTTAPKWLLLVPSPATRCGAQIEGEALFAQANEQVPVPSRPNAITLVTIRPAKSIVETVVDFVAKPSVTQVFYGEGTWRLAQNPEAVELMLNGPVSHPAFVFLPPVPHPTIALSRAASFEFSFVELVGSQAQTAAGTIDPDVPR